MQVIQDSLSFVNSAASRRRIWSQGSPTEIAANSFSRAAACTVWHADYNRRRATTVEVKEIETKLDRLVHQGTAWSQR